MTTLGSASRRLNVPGVAAEILKDIEPTLTDGYPDTEPLHAAAPVAAFDRPTALDTVHHIAAAVPAKRCGK
jgi:hypothetical protein